MDPSAELAASLSGEQIAKVLRTSGPTVKCVLLRCSPTTGSAASSKARHDSKPSAQDSDERNDNDDDNDIDNNDDKTSSSKTVLIDLIEEIMVDTTPKKQMVAQVIGGPFTFLGQYEDEGIIVIVRRPEDMEGSDDDEDEDGDGEGSDVLVNPHELQPPLHNLEVRGDILLMRVAATEEEEEGKEEELLEESEEQDQDQDGEKKVSDDGAKDGETDAKEDDGGNESEAEEDESSPGEEGAAKAIAGKIMSNEEFFLDYTKEEYIKFASRTDIIPQEEPEEEEEDNVNEIDDDDDGDEEDDEDAEEYNVESDSDEMEDDEEHQIGMMNLILAQILKRFREENGRGPNTAELLAMRSALAEKLGIDESIINQSEAVAVAVDEDGNDNKRRADTSEDALQREKRVKFTNKDEIKIMTDDERTDNEATTE